MSHLNVQIQVLIFKLRKFISYIYLIIAFPPSVLFLPLALLLYVIFPRSIFSCNFDPFLHIFVLCFQLLRLERPGSSFKSPGRLSSPSIHLLKCLIGKIMLFISRKASQAAFKSPYVLLLYFVRSASVSSCHSIALTMCSGNHYFSLLYPWGSCWGAGGPT